MNVTTAMAAKPSLKRKRIRTNRRETTRTTGWNNRNLPRQALAERWCSTYDRADGTRITHRNRDLYQWGGMFTVYAVWLGVPLALIGAVFLWVKMPDRWQERRHAYLRKKRRRLKAMKKGGADD